MKSFSKLLFSTPGIPLSTPGKDTIAGIKQVKALGLDAMELEFVHSIYLTKESAVHVGHCAKEEDIILTIHAPYTLNLNAENPGIRYATINRVVQCAEVGHALGALSVVFHPGFYLKQDPSEVYQTIRKGFEKMLTKLDEQSLNIQIAPETTGKPTQFGSLEELVGLAKEINHPKLGFCIDFAHLHARSNGKYNTKEEFCTIFDYIGQELGGEKLKRMHMHYSGLTYSEKGEKKHLPFKESDAAYETLLEVMKIYDVRGILVIESPIMETDCLMLKNLFYPLWRGD